MPSNDQVERRVAALSRPELIYPDSSILPDLERSYAACPLQRKLDLRGKWVLVLLAIAMGNV
jgi:hypothetical protein